MPFDNKLTDELTDEEDNEPFRKAKFDFDSFTFLWAKTWTSQLLSNDYKGGLHFCPFPGDTAGSILSSKFGSCISDAEKFLKSKYDESVILE